jgi:hypothetical protein
MPRKIIPIRLFAAPVSVRQAALLPGMWLQRILAVGRHGACSRLMQVFFSGICLWVLNAPAVWAQPASGPGIAVTLKGYHEGQLYLGNYYGSQTYIIDSARISPAGTAIFEGTDTLPGGIYFVLLPQKRKYFEVLIDSSRQFSLVADTSDGFRNIRISGSPENALFRQYNSFLRKEREKLDAAARQGADSSRLRVLQAAVGKEIQAYRDGFCQDHPRGLLSAIFRAMKDPVVPPSPDPADSSFSFRYFKGHYWDQVDFSDNRLLRTPVLETRLERYFTQLVPPQVDSINAEADQMLIRAGADKEVFKYVLWWLTYHYETSPYMGMDAVFVHLVEKYYMTGQAYWLTKEQTDKIVNRAAQIAPNLIGNQAPNLKLRTPDMKSLSLWDVKADYTILIFWDPTCGHCQVVVPQLDSAYNHWKQQGVKIVGVLAGGTEQQWKDYIQQNHLDDWINAWDPDRQSDYRRLYDVYMTPVIYLLDARKKILAKKLDVAQLGGFLAHLRQLAGREPHG